MLRSSTLGSSTRRLWPASQSAAVAGNWTREGRGSSRVRLLMTLAALILLWLAAPMPRAMAAPGAAAPALSHLSASIQDQGGDDSGGSGDESGDQSGHDGQGSNDDDDGDGDDDWKGYIVYRPDEGLVGTWTIQIDAAVVLTVTTSTDTRFRPGNSGAFVPGQWVEVDGVRQPDGSVAADRFRLDDYESGQVVVRLQDELTDVDLKVFSAKYGLTYLETWSTPGNIYLFGVAEDDEKNSANRLLSAGDKRVVWAEPNYVFSVPQGDGYKTWAWGGPIEPDAYTGQSAYLQMGLGYEAKQYQGDGVIVAVLDTGIYTAHEQFAGRLLLPSLDVIQDDPYPDEVPAGLAWGHGTHVAGVIAAMAPEATLLPIRVLDENGRGNTFLLAYAIEWAAEHGAQVINLSLGTDANSRILQDVIAEVIEQGVVVVAAAGNRGLDMLQYPAAYPGVIGVTAVDGENHKASFANYGAQLVDLAAPGVGIMSTMISAEGPGYAAWSGTSMSAAFVSGAAALVLDQDSDLAATRSVVLAATVVERLTVQGTDLDALNRDYAGKIGRGLNVSAALSVTPPVRSILLMPVMRR